MRADKRKALLVPMSITLPAAIGSAFNSDSPRARRSDPHTSHEAADTSDVSASIGLVLQWFKIYGPLADHELVAELCTAFSGQRLRTARAALVERGLVEASGSFRLTPSRRRAQVWQLVSA